MAHPETSVGVLLMAFGGPNSPEEVEPFLQRVLGRRVPAQRVDEAKRRYGLIGGRSPLLEMTLRQARGLEQCLNVQGTRFKVYVGMRHWHPFIAASLGEALKDGIRRVVAFSLAPYQSTPYVLELRRAMAALKGEIALSVVEGWHAHPLFIQALAEKLQEGLVQFPAEVRDGVHVIFSAHSLPQKAVAGTHYVEHIEGTIRGIVRIAGPLPWRLAFQSRGGAPGKWLGPDVGTVLGELMRGGHQEVLIVPMGFVADNLETLYDIDILFRRQAESMGMSFRRCPSLNDSHTFIEALCSIVRKHLMDERQEAHEEMEEKS